MADRPGTSQSAEESGTEELLVLVAGTERARSILSRRGLTDLSNCSVSDLVAEGLTPNAAHRLSSAFELGRRLAQRPLVRGKALPSTSTVFDAYHARMRDLKVEQFWVLCIDAKGRVQRELMASQGTLTNALVHPREVFRIGIREAAHGLILLHNHPSGDPEPSDEDRDLTRRLQAVGELVGIRVLDHLVIGDGAYVSFVERGLLPSA
jgi:DNA repair protein RadC